MNCSNDPRQLELPFFDPFDHFRVKISKLVHQGISTELCAELRNKARFSDFPLVASWCRRLLREYVDVQAFSHAGTLLESFGLAFQGDTVGHIGRDLLGAALHSNNEHYRSVAVSVLGRWLERDQDGMWLEEAERHLDREQNEALRVLLRTRLINHSVQRLWQYVTEQESLEEDVQPQAKESGDGVFIEEFLEVRRGCDIEIKGTVPTKKLPDLLERVLNLHPHMTLGFIESLKVGHLCVRESNLGLRLTSVPGGYLLRVWDPEGSFAMSLEPTATEDRWLLFAYC